MITIRKIEPGDREDFLSMAQEFYNGPGVLHAVPSEVFERTFDELSSDSKYLEGYIFEKDGVSCGYGLLSLSFSPEVGGQSIFIEEIYVRACFRGEGIGHRFLDMVTSRTDARVRRIRLEAVKSNERAIALYKRYGFCELDYLQMVKDKKEETDTTDISEEGR